MTANALESGLHSTSMLNRALGPISGLDLAIRFKVFPERIEKLEEEKKATSDDIRDVYAEAKGNGFDAKALRTIVRMRKMDVDERREQQDVLDTYLNALGMLQ